MQASLVSSLSSMRISARPQPALSFKASVGGQQIVAAPARTSVVTAAVFTVEAKQNSLKRERTAERNRVYNKSRKSEIATRMKKVLTALDAYKGTPPATEADLAPVSSMISEAYQVLDKAVVKGILHRNTAARRKARLAKARRNVLISAGLYTPQ
ncbi:hypothetical protein Ndes2526B_g08498 [Nannochloris sp. 'desiccata']|nr:hypothetical protein KSW81_001904 [Chlorella desiccata (nom. nud.)]KAH7616351.1 putative 30S ribosomal protein S20, chloroplastic [Chlorella desiccata (nom. nud.)]KAH7616404.1 putative 30S ribosomal protein S20, chloroplastic [Chlorella desiccata (nom. nud.)]